MKLKTENKKLKMIQHQLYIEFEWEEVVKRIPETIMKFRKNSEFDGFRKGKAPESVVRVRVGEEKLREHAANDAA